MRPATDVTMLVRSSPRMLLVSAISYAVNFGIFALLVKFAEWPPEIAAVVGIVTVTALNFLACRYFIFEARDGSIRRQLFLYLASTTAFRAAELATFSLIYRTVPSNALVVYPIVLAVSYVAKYVFAGLVVFKKSYPETHP